MNELQVLRRDAIREMESVDDILRGLNATIEIMTMGASAMANGETIADMLTLIKVSVNDARALLDDATGAVMKMRVMVA